MEKKTEKECYGLAQGSQIFANCQEEIMASPTQISEMQQEKWHTFTEPQFQEIISTKCPQNTKTSLSIKLTDKKQSMDGIYNQMNKWMDG